MDVKFVQLGDGLCVAVERKQLRLNQNKLLLAKFLGAQYHEQCVMVSDDEIVKDIKDSLKYADEQDWEHLVYFIEDQRFIMGDGEKFK